MNILKSATKSVFVLTAITICVGFFLNKISEQAFLSLATLVFSFYYAKGKEISQETQG